MLNNNRKPLLLWNPLPRLDSMISQFTEGVNSCGGLWDIMKAHAEAFLAVMTNTSEPVSLSRCSRSPWLSQNLIWRHLRAPSPVRKLSSWSVGGFLSCLNGSVHTWFHVYTDDVQSQHAMAVQYTHGQCKQYCDKTGLMLSINNLVLPSGHNDPSSCCDNFTQYKNKVKHFLLTFALWRIWDCVTVKRKCLTLLCIG